MVVARRKVLALLGLSSAALLAPVLSRLGQAATEEETAFAAKLLAAVPPHGERSLGRPDAPVVMALRAEGAGEPRVTLTARVLNGAIAKHLLIAGAEKRAAFDRAQTLPPEDAPVRAVLADTAVHWAA